MQFSTVVAAVTFFLMTLRFCYQLLAVWLLAELM